MAEIQRPGKDDLLESVEKLVDLANTQAKTGVVHYGVLKEGLSLTTSNTPVFHGLGRLPSYVIPCKLSANATVYSDTPHDDARNYINLKASATVTASVLIA